MVRSTRDRAAGKSCLVWKFEFEAKSRVQHCVKISQKPLQVVGKALDNCSSLRRARPSKCGSARKSRPVLQRATCTASQNGCAVPSTAFKNGCPPRGTSSQGCASWCRQPCCAVVQAPSLPKTGHHVRVTQPGSKIVEYRWHGKPVLRPSRRLHGRGGAPPLSGRALKSRGFLEPAGGNTQLGPGWHLPNPGSRLSINGAQYTES